MTNYEQLQYAELLECVETSPIDRDAVSELVSRYKSLANFFGMFAHEVRSPIGTIAGSAELILEILQGKDRIVDAQDMNELRKFVELSREYTTRLIEVLDNCRAEIYRHKEETDS